MHLGTQFNDVFGVLEYNLVSNDYWIVSYTHTDVRAFAHRYAWRTNAICNRAKSLL